MTGHEPVRSINIFTYEDEEGSGDVVYLLLPPGHTEPAVVWVEDHGTTRTFNSDEAGGRPAQVLDTDIGFRALSDEGPGR